MSTTTVPSSTRTSRRTPRSARVSIGSSGSVTVPATARASSTVRRPLWPLWPFTEGPLWPLWPVVAAVTTWPPGPGGPGPAGGGAARQGGEQPGELRGVPTGAAPGRRVRRPLGHPQRGPLEHLGEHGDDLLADLGRVRPPSGRGEPRLDVRAGEEGGQQR